MKAQSSLEYMLLIGFVTLAISVVLITAYFYINFSKDRIKENQVENFSGKIISSAESVFFSGEPSQTTITIYIPSGVEDINFNAKELEITYITSSGTNKVSFSSRVDLSGEINKLEGTKILIIKALENEVLITQKQ